MFVILVWEVKLRCFILSFQSPQSRVRGEKAISLGGAVCEVPTDYSKRPHVFRLNLPNGGQYLLQCKSNVSITLFITWVTSRPTVLSLIDC